MQFSSDSTEDIVPNSRPGNPFRVYVSLTSAIDGAGKSVKFSSRNKVRL
jgi:hypothetical protein